MDYKDQVAQVYQRISQYVKKTPVIKSSYFSQKTGSEIYFKLENIQHTNSFKVRGAFSKITSLQDKSKALVATSGGNHGLGVAYAARTFGMKAVIIVPEFVPQFRIDMIRALGAEVVVYGQTMEDLNAKASEYTADPNYVYIHPFDEDEVIAGQGTIAHELLEQLPDVEAIVASIGGGGLISGISQYAKSVNPNIKIYGVQTDGANAMLKSLAAGELVGIPSITSVATSLGATKVSDRTFNIVRQNVEKVEAVTDEEAIDALKNILDKDKLLVEPASSCNVAAILQDKFPELRRKKVAVIMCGGNFSLEQLKKYL